MSSGCSTARQFSWERCSRPRRVYGNIDWSLSLSTTIMGYFHGTCFLVNALKLSLDEDLFRDQTDSRPNDRDLLSNSKSTTNGLFLGGSWKISVNSLRFGRLFSFPIGISSSLCHSHADKIFSLVLRDKIGSLLYEKWIVAHIEILRGLPTSSVFPQYQTENYEQGQFEWE